MTTNFYVSSFKSGFISLFVCFNALFLTSAFSQHIPDANFANAIRRNCAACIDASNNLTATAATFTNLGIGGSNINDLTGIQGFTNLTQLFCDDNNLTTFPILPTTLTQLSCNRNQLTSLPLLPNTLTYFSFNNNKLTRLPNVPTALRTLFCWGNLLTTLPSLPNGLIYMDISFNKLQSLPTLPNTLQTLFCEKNQLQSLPSLPNGLVDLTTYDNLLQTLPALPNGLTYLNCLNNQLAQLPTLPNALTTLNCSQNQLQSLPTLPNNLQTLRCTQNQLTSLPSLPNSIFGLYCYSNLLGNLPTLPSNLATLSCYNNNIQSLPTLPMSLRYLYLDAAKIGCLPNFPTDLLVYDQNTTMPDLRSTYPLCATIVTHPSVPDLVCNGVSINLVAKATNPSPMTVKWQRQNFGQMDYVDLTTATAYTSGTDAIYAITPDARFDQQAKYRAVFIVSNAETATNFAQTAISTGIYIPDANFAAAIRTACPTCIDACNNLTAAAANLTTLNVISKNISDLTGLEGFTNLQVLNCSANQLTSLPTLPTTLRHLICANNQITSLLTLPSGLIQLYIDNNRVATLPTLPSTLQILYAGGNLLTALPTALPTGLQYFSCWSNQITALPSSLPSGLIELGVYNTPLSILPNLPTTLQHLSCYATTIDCLPTLPMGLTTLLLDPTKVTCLPNYPTNVAIYNGASTTNIRNSYALCSPPTITKHPSVADLTCGTTVTLLARATTFNATTVKWQRKGAADATYTDLNAATAYTSGSDATYPFTRTNADNDASYRAVFTVKCNESITNAVILRASLNIHIPDVNFANAIRTVCATCIDACNDLTTDASTVTSLDVSSKNIQDLTGLGGFTQLQVLNCQQNQLTTLPTLPNSLKGMICQNNQLTALPTLPNGFTTLYGDNNRFTSLPTLPNSLLTLYVGGNQLTTLPTLPSGLLRFSCWSNQITALPTTLPSNLLELGVYNNPLSNLPILPTTLQHLSCYGTSITCLPTLPMGLMQLLLDPTKTVCLPNAPTNVAIYNGAGTTNIRNTFSLCTPPTIVTHPSVTNPVCIGGSATLTASATGTGVMTVKWQLKRVADADYSDISTPVAYTSGATASQNITFTANDNAAFVRAVFTASCVSWETNAAPIFLNSGTYIPDVNFANAIRTICPTCITDCNYLTSDAGTLTTLNVGFSNITNLTGIEGFANLTSLYCSNNNLVFLPNLPTNLFILDCNSNQLESLPTLPANLTALHCGSNQLTSLPTLPNSIRLLKIASNKLTTLPNLPNDLTVLYGSFNRLTSLPTLPSGLTWLECVQNLLTSLPALPNGLTDLLTNNNLLTNLPTLPNTLTNLDCAFNQLQSLPTLPNSLIRLDCSHNLLQSLPTLPSNLVTLGCYDNLLESLPAFPNSLKNLICTGNNITCLPTLPNGLAVIWLDNTKITCLPNLPPNVAISTPTGVYLDRATYPICARPTLITHPSVSNPVCVDNVVFLTAKAVGPSYMTVRWQGKRATDANYVEIVPPSTYASGTVASANIVVEAASEGNSYRAVFSSCNGDVVTNATTFRVSTGFHIPNVKFAAAIRNDCANCIDGCDNLTPNAATLTTLNVSTGQISDLTGIEQFTNLTALYCNYNPLTSLPNNLPNGLTTLSCTNTSINALPTLPSGLTTLYCGGTFLNSLPNNLPTNLRTLDCSNAYLTALPNTLPSGLLTLNCKSNQLTALPTDMPFTLTEVNCDNNALTRLPVFSSALRFLYCRNNQITNLLSVPFSSLSSNLRYLYCSNNQLTNLPESLPSNLLEIECYDNNIYCLPTLPNSLTNIKLDALKITCLPNAIAGLVIQNRDNMGDLSGSYALCTAPSVTTAPSVSGTYLGGQQAIFTSRATTNSVTTVKWQRKGAADMDFSDIAGTEIPYASATNTSYTTPPLTINDINASYRAVFVTQCSGNATTTAAKLTAAVLPVELLSFSGKNTEGGNILTWATAEEKNVSHFDIERSTDGRVFEKIGETKATGSHSTYQFTDDKTSARFETSTTLTTIYYRLKINDLNGIFDYSKIISIETKAAKTKAIKVYPNPATDVVTLEIPFDTEGVEIVNAIGQIVFRGTAKDKNTLQVDVSTWQAGVYFIKTTGATGFVKFVKQ